VWRIRVRPGHRGKGIPHALLEGAVTYVRSHGPPANSNQSAGRSPSSSSLGFMTRTHSIDPPGRLDARSSAMGAKSLHQRQAERRALCEPTSRSTVEVQERLANSRAGNLDRTGPRTLVRQSWLSGRGLRFGVGVHETTFRVSVRWVTPLGEETASTS
jgi:hypothetical protein